MNKADFTFTAGRNDYVIFYRGRSLGGAGVMLPRRKPLRGRQVAKAVEGFRKSAELEIQQILEGRGQFRFRKEIEIIDLQLKMEEMQAKLNEAGATKATAEEQELLDLTVKVWNKWLDLKEEHAGINSEVCQAVHTIQCRVAYRVARRVDPQLWGS